MPLNNKKLLEIGSGFGTNLATWIKSYEVDGYGTEPDGEGFGTSFSASRELFVANGLDPERVIPVKGETLPFADASFDIVYSANVLEHTEDPQKVLEEAVRVLRPGGTLHCELPNFLSYFEGHYMVPQPPILWRSMLPQWVRLLGARSILRTDDADRNQPCVVPARGKEGGREIPCPAVILGERDFPRPSGAALQV